MAAIRPFDRTMTSAEERRDFLELLDLAPSARYLEPSTHPHDAAEASFDALLCIDGIAALRDRGAVLADWARIVKPRGRILYTDPAIVAGLVTNEELSLRASMGFFVFSCQGENESLIDAAGLRLKRADDATDAAASVASRRHALRLSHEPELVAEEGRDLFDARQRFLEVSHRLAAERRLARIAFLCEKAP
jgi:SAM-dependent methyltransferase